MSLYKLLALDIDGTILDRENRISHGVIEAMQRAIAAGVKVTVCTGRGIASSQPIVSRLPVNAPLILQGGALIIEHYGGEVLYWCNIPNAIARRTVRVFRKASLTPIVYEAMPAGHRFFYDRRTIWPEALQLYINAQPERATEVCDLLADITEDPSVVGTVGPEDVVMSAHDALTQALPEVNVIPEYSTWYPSNAWLYAFPKEVTKGIALRRLTEYLGLRREEVAAIGDNLNDIDMLMYARLGIAMQNSPDEVKRVANCITDSNDNDGLAKAINRFILPRCSTMHA